MWRDKKVSLIFPTYREKNSIYSAIVDFESSGYLDEIIVVDNNAEFGTTEEIERKKSPITKIVKESQQGYGYAIRKGLREATGDLIIVSEPDGTFFGRDVVKFLSYSDDFDVVYGSRTSRELIWKGANMGVFLRWGNLFVAKVMEVLFNTTNLTDVGCTYRLLSRRVLDELLEEFTIGKEHFGPEMMLLTFLHSFRVVQIPVNYRKRIGRSSVTGDFFKASWLGLQMIILIAYYRFSHYGGFHLGKINNSRT